MQHADAIWSMIPQGTPTKTFSARWHSWAMRRGVSPSPYRSLSAVAVTTSSAADDDSPAPVGTVDSKCRSAPPAAPVSSPASRSAQTTPAG